MFTSDDSFFIADCHLQGSRPDVVDLFSQFLASIKGAGELWILGDFIEYWLGDDAGNPELDSVFQALANTQSAGTNVHLMHGNRDFLLGQAFANRLGVTVHAEDEITIERNGESILLMHGDTVCTDDTDYQTLRTLLRSNEWQSSFLQQSIQDRMQAAQSLREKSREATADKSQLIMDVNEQAVQAVFERTGVTTLLHGHTHRPNIHTVSHPDIHTADQANIHAVDHLDTHAADQTNTHTVDHRDTHEVELKADSDSAANMNKSRLVLGDWSGESAVIGHSGPTDITKTVGFSRWLPGHASTNDLTTTSCPIKLFLIESHRN